MKKRHLTWAFIVTVVLQLFVCGKMIYDSEMTYNSGTVFNFKTSPIDPTDPFRGKYITLNYELSTFYTNDTTFTNSERAYVVLRKGKNGFAEIAALSHKKPDVANYVVAEVNYSYGGKVNLNFPFDRFYMEETKAPKAEKAYEEYSNKKAMPAYAIIAVKDGNAVVKDVIIDNVPIADYVSGK